MLRFAFGADYVEYLRDDHTVAASSTKVEYESIASSHLSLHLVLQQLGHSAHVNVPDMKITDVAAVDVVDVRTGSGSGKRGIVFGRDAESHELVFAAFDFEVDLVVLFRKKVVNRRIAVVGDVGIV